MLLVTTLIKVTHAEPPSDNTCVATANSEPTVSAVLHRYTPKRTPRFVKEVAQKDENVAEKQDSEGLGVHLGNARHVRNMPSLGIRPTCGETLAAEPTQRLRRKTRPESAPRNIATRGEEPQESHHAKGFCHADGPLPR